MIFTQPRSADRSPQIVAEALSARIEMLDPLAADPLTQLCITAERPLASWSEP
ncbi:MAG: hypothetical protein MPN21_06080 [Thermoanaerobaculia bacterium]|nr:hypothetical protein [Thermoanaerobaculia bacterium]